MRLFQVALPFLILFLFFSCQQDDTPSPTIQESTFPNVDEALWPYFKEFEYQASLRGLLVDLAAENIIGKIEELSEEHVAGQCSYGVHIDNEITIDKTFWNDFPVSYKEMVVFHELGHCYLSRGHREGTYPDGTCMSIMRSGLEDCRDNYTASTKKKYLDELFSMD